MTKLRRFTFPFLIGILLLVLAACGGDDDDDTPAATDTGSGSTASTAPTASTGLDFNFQYACISRTLNPCVLLIEPGGLFDKIREATNGQIDIQASSFPELGLAGPDTLRLIADGTLEMGEIYSGYVGGDLPILDVANLWGLVPDNATNFRTIEAVREPLHALLEERSNGVVLGESYYGDNFFYAKRPLRTRADFEGMKTRSHSTILGDLINGTGAEAQFVAFAEVYTGLERGILDAAVTCGTCGSGLRWFEVTDYLVGPISSIGVTYFTVNKDVWNKIPDDLQAIMIDEIAKNQANNRELVQTVWPDEGKNENIAGGMEFMEFTDEVKATLKAASVELVVPNWVDRTGGPNSEAVQMFNTYVSPILGVNIDASGKAVPN